MAVVRAGWAAAIYASRANLKPLVYEGAMTNENYQNGTMPLGQLSLTTDVENYPGFPSGVLTQFLDTSLDKDARQLLAPNDEKHPVTGPELMNLMRQQAKNFGTRVITDDIVDVDFQNRPFTLTASDGTVTKAHSVIIATGARANYLGLDSENEYKNKGVSACAVCDGALPMFRDKPLVVIGGGDSAIEEATYLTNFASTVYLVHRRDEFRASKIMADRAINNDKIDIVWNHTVDEVLGDGAQVTGLKLKNTVDGSDKELPAAGMFVAIGHTPNTSFLKGQIDTNDKGYINWTKSFRTDTSVEGVFAAGDVADDNYRQAITSAGTGCMAALDAERWLVREGL